MKLLNQENVAAAVIHNESNIFYLSGGYTGEGCLFLAANFACIITDFRYVEQAHRQAPHCEVRETAHDCTQTNWIATLCQQRNVTQLYYEDDTLTVRQGNTLRSGLPVAVELKSLEEKPEQLRQIKTANEIKAIQEACRITSETFRLILPKIREGMTEKELKLELEFTQMKLGAQGNSFDPIVASGVNGSLPHAIPSDKKIAQGEMITLDFGCKVDGYCSDMTRTVALGTPSPEMKRIYDTVLVAQEMGEAALKPGVPCQSVDKVCRDYIDSQGYEGRFGHGLGHSLGIDVHENPRLNPVCTDITQVGMLLTVEPGIYVPGLGGVRIENTCLVTETGNTPLTTAPKKLIIL